ncbi:MAG: hypothetical protein R3D57_02740 [Hyphomicrobiaceae bacterium]
MLQSLITKVQRSFQSAIGDMALRMVVALPFAVGAGFGIAAGASWIYRQFGTEHGNLLLAGGFTALGLIGVLIFSLRPAATSTPEPLAEDSAAGQASQAENSGLHQFFATVDGELLLSLAGTLLPLFMPRRQAVLRAVPILAVVGLIALLIMRSHPSRTSQGGNEQQEPFDNPGLDDSEMARAEAA